MLTLKQIVDLLQFEVLTGEDLLERHVEKGYACDMLSWVMSHAGPTDIWMTILNSMNVIAVAVLTECACVLLTEKVDLPNDVLERAKDKKIIVIRTSLTTYEASFRIFQVLKQNDSLSV